MKQFFLIAALVLAAPSYAADAPASEATVREFLAVTKAKDVLDSVWGQIDQSMDMGIKAALNGQAVTPEQQKIIDGMRSKIVAIFKDELAWDKLEPVFLEVYEKSFTQKELEPIIAFYKTPAGQAMVAKMPVVMQNTNAAMVGRIQAMMPRIQQMERDMMADLKAQGAK